LITLGWETEPATSAMRPDIAGFVLAGGRSSRMGVDKALVQFADRPLVAHAVGLLRAAGIAAAIAGARSQLQDFAPVIEDERPDAGPLSGICAALASTPARWAVFLSVDLPLLPASLLVYLLHHARITGAAVTVPSVNGFAQTFPAVVDRAALPVLREELDAGRGGCFAAFKVAAAARAQAVKVLPVELLVQTGQISHPHCLPAARWFLNVNSQADLERAEALATRISQHRTQQVGRPAA
jgi:molybdopterin-guanine dinucleotide biosynthesis protein A